MEDLLGTQRARLGHECLVSSRSKPSYAYTAAGETPSIFCVVPHIMMSAESHLLPLPLEILRLIIAFNHHL